MEIIQIGSMAILLKWILLGISVFTGMIYIRIWRNEYDESKHLFELLTNSLILAFFAWKGSLVLLEPSIVLKSAFSLLYFTGGNNGLILAFIALVIYFFYKGRRSSLPYLTETIFVFSFVVLAMYHILIAVLIDELLLYHIIIGTYSILVISFTQLKRVTLNSSIVFLSTILFGFLNIVVSFFFAKNNHLYLFTFQQWFYMALIVICLFYWNKERKNEESC